MNNKVLGCLMAVALSTTLALASPALARGGGGGGGGGGGHGGGMMGGGMHGGGWGGGMHGMSGGPHFSGARFAGNHFAQAGGFHNQRFFHHRHAHFAFIGAPYAYAAYDSCWRPVWTAYGRQWVDVCGNYDY